MDQRGEDGVENVVEVFPRVVRQEAQDEVPVLLQKRILSPVAPVGFGVRQMLRAADGLALGQVTMPHPLLGEMTAYEWLATLGTHEARHAAQIREISGD